MVDGLDSKRYNNSDDPRTRHHPGKVPGLTLGHVPDERVLVSTSLGVTTPLDEQETEKDQTVQAVTTVVQWSWAKSCSLQ